MIMRVEKFTTGTLIRVNLEIEGPLDDDIEIPPTGNQISLF